MQIYNPCSAVLDAAWPLLCADLWAQLDAAAGAVPLGDLAVVILDELPPAPPIYGVWTRARLGALLTAFLGDIPEEREPLASMIEQVAHDPAPGLLYCYVQIGTRYSLDVIDPSAPAPRARGAA